MTAALDISRLLDTTVEQPYVGFSTATRSVKPVHIANGLFRSLTGLYADTELLNRLAFFQKADGGPLPSGYSLDEIFARLRDNGRLDDEVIDRDDLASFRVMLKQVLHADDGV